MRLTVACVLLTPKSSTKYGNCWNLHACIVLVRHPYILALPLLLMPAATNSHHGEIVVEYTNLGGRDIIRTVLIRIHPNYWTLYDYQS